jgi:hypothetical protein
MVCLACASSPASAQPIDVTNVPQWTAHGNPNNARDWGVGSTATYGETLIVPVGATTLNQFSFFVPDTFGGDTFAGYVQQFNGASQQPIGAPLFVSGVLTDSGADTLGGDTELTVSGFSAPVTAGEDILFALTVLNTGGTGEQGAGIPGTSWGAVASGTGTNSNHYLFNNNSNTFAAITAPGAPWSDFFGPTFKSAFDAEFNTAPEVDPKSATAPVALALGGLMLMSDRRRARKQS